MLTWRSGDFSSRKEFYRRSSPLPELTVALYLTIYTAAREIRACINTASIAERVVAGIVQEEGRMKSKPAHIGDSERTAYRSPKRLRWPHRIKSWPSSPCGWVIIRSCASFSCSRIHITLNETTDRQLLLRSPTALYVGYVSVRQCTHAQLSPTVPCAAR
ncbi:hypothetical protein EJ02DRAFT_259719 [Clathrospora elynae]|uniref:Uncharacterized protein n=1 Tax=Clathrospora elynae TaxID=706981 RepID=A0A6A5SF41_9PLEO|nr:hypothetical protein EJ02DRAFT_259719 [Clathrospora elynae]